MAGAAGPTPSGRPSQLCDGPGRRHHLCRYLRRTLGAGNGAVAPLVRPVAGPPDSSQPPQLLHTGGDGVQDEERM